MEAESLNKHDAEQVAFMAEECILVDESDAVTGSASKADCHHGEGVLHRAFSILIFNSFNFITDFSLYSGFKDCCGFFFEFV